MNTTIEFTRIKNDVNGNPRYVCHFLNLSLDNDRIELNKENPGYITSVEGLYNIALKRAKTIGGKKYHSKSYGGGIVFQSYNLLDTEKKILGLLN
jgi:hypothetical protein